LRDFLSKLERGKRAARRAHFPRELGHKSQGGIFVLSVVVFLLGQVVLYGSVQVVQQQTLAQKSRQEVAHFRGSFSEFSEGGRSYRKKVQQPVVGTFFEVPISANPYSCTDCGTNFKADLWWDSFVL
jgi:hypothetical protein